MSAQSYVTMITPYRADGSVDIPAAEQLVDWYADKGCHGIFATCQSGEIQFLSREERLELARAVVGRVRAVNAAPPQRVPVKVVISGHVSADTGAAAEELCEAVKLGPDGLILITNRFDAENTSDSAWIADAEKLLAHLPSDITLGLYECPKPYKRLLTPTMLQWCVGTGRFGLIKDTCCDAAEMARRVRLTEGSSLRLFNANAQTLLESLRSGAAGYCGIMANFQPDLYAWLCENYEKHPRTAEELQAFLCVSAFTEHLCYPVTAKYHLSALAGLPMTVGSRACDPALLTDYAKSCVRQMEVAAGHYRALIADPARCR